MDVPSREEFEELKGLVEALCRHLQLSPTPCHTHSDFADKVKKAIRNCDPTPYDCPDCGAIFSQKNPTKFEPL